MSLARHRTPYAGSWYPGERAELEALLGEMFAESEQRTGPALPPDPAAYVVPHAGLEYSGRVAAAVFRRLSGQPPDSVVLLGFSHRGGPFGLWAPEVAGYTTPLGNIAVDGERLEKLLESGAARRMDEAALCDHSVEIQLPLIQWACPDAVVLPLYVAGLGEDERRRNAEALASLAGPGVVFLASSDFTHFGAPFGYQPFPVNKLTRGRLHDLDADFIEAAGSIDPGFFLRYLSAQKATVCGREPMALLLEILRALEPARDFYQQTLDYMTSGELTGDYSHCVSYAALGYVSWESLQLGSEDAELLLDCARRTIGRYRETGRPDPAAPLRETPALKRPAAAFVSLHKNGELRGCVGRIAAEEPLGRTVPEMTLAAALEDSRFPPLGRDETGIEIEVSVLSPMRRLADPQRLRPGVDGGYLKLGDRSGLLLPQVARERDWNSARFLAALASKAHLSEKAYADPASRLYSFRAQVIREAPAAAA